MRRDVRLLVASLAVVTWVGGARLPSAYTQMGPMGGQAAGTRARMAEPTEHGTRTVGGLEITLLTAPPLAQEQMAKMMPGMMQGMGGMQGMGAMGGQPTHWIGVIVRDVREDGVVPDLQITLAARKDGLARTVTLMPLPGSYGANISLPEKGRFNVTVTITRPGQPLNVPFDFDYN